MQLTIEFDREEDGRWIAEVMEISGALAYGTTTEEAERKALAIALITLGYRLERGELQAPESVVFVAA